MAASHPAPGVERKRDRMGKEWIKARKSWYKGTTYDSNAEGKTAESFDKLGLAFQPQPITPRGDQYDGGQYTPDFLLLGTGTYVEVAGVWDSRHAHNAAAMIRDFRLVPSGTGEFGVRPGFVRIDGDGYICGVTAAGESLPPGEVVLGVCADCGRAFFLDSSGTYECPACGAHDGDHHLTMWNNLFDAAGVRRYGGR